MQSTLAKQLLFIHVKFKSILHDLKIDQIAFDRFTVDELRYLK